MRISDWSSDVCSSDLSPRRPSISSATNDGPAACYVSSCAVNAPPPETSYRSTISTGGGSIRSSRTCPPCSLPLRWSKPTTASAAGSPKTRSASSKKTSGCSTDRKNVVEGKRVSVRVDLGGRRNNKKKKKNNIT